MRNKKVFAESEYKALFWAFKKQYFCFLVSVPADIDAGRLELKTSLQFALHTVPDEAICVGCECKQLAIVRVVRYAKNAVDIDSFSL